jgi:outer membrane protein OmpA-like peptidoglycan-associated protein
MTARAQLRTARAWRDYDRANYWVLVGLFFTFMVWMLWHGNQPEALPTPALAPTDSPVQMRKLPTVVPLNLRVVGARLVLSGDVPDAASSQALRAAGEAVFGVGKVDDRLSIHSDAEALAWRDHLPDMLRMLSTTGGEAALTIAGKQVTLSGEVAQESTRTARALMAQNWFGRSATVDNQLRVAAAAASAPRAVATTASQSFGSIMAGAASAAAAASSASAAVAAPAASTAVAPAVAAAPAPNPACAPLAQGVTVRFHPSATALHDEGRRTLRELMPCLSEGRWQVGVHTDSNGDPAANQALTQGRADAVVAYLVSRKLPADRLLATGFGASRPVAGNETTEDRLRNRRVTFERQP